MFSITKLSPSSQTFVTELNSTMQTRTRAVSLAVAKVMADNAALPSSAVDDIVAFYRTHCQIDIEMKVNEINELMALDTKQVIEYCLKLYTLRYYFMAPPAIVYSFNKETAVEDFFGISRCIDRETISSVIKVDCGNIARFVGKFNDMYNELFKQVLEQNTNADQGNGAVANLTS